jgi:tetratricopeptide (TPR) repeat protein
VKADLLILQICDFLDDGDGFYRLHEPSRQLSRLPGVVVVDCHFYHHLLPGLVEAADVIVLPFVHNEDFFPVVEQRRSAGRITVFEANDYFYDVQPWNTVGPAWQDRAIQEEYRNYMAVADAVQTSTEELARRWRPWSRQVAVFPNQLTEVPPLTPPPARPLTVGWGGSPGHFADWLYVAPVLERCLRAHPDVHLAVMTNEYARPFFRLPPERYHFTPFGSLAAYLKFLPSLDVGLAPLLPSDYNRCRSDVKYLEYASHGVAGVYADLEPYRGSVRPGDTGLLYRTPEELTQQLDRLMADRALRHGIRQRAHAQAATERRLADHIGQRLDFYQRLLPGPPRGATLSPEVLAAAVADGRYLQLRPGEPERNLLAAAQGLARPEAVQALTAVLARYPRYVPALQQQGRLLNDLRRASQAEICLGQALALEPASARTLCELGRSRFLQGDVPGARRRLAEALTLNPYYQAGWQYLLRLLGLNPSADSPEWAEKARRAHPANWQLALAAARAEGGGRALPALGRWLDQFVPGLGVEERPPAAAAFSEAAAEVAGHVDAAEAAALLGRGCEAFPESARLADALGRALARAGDHPASRAAYARALAIRRRATAYRLGYPKDDPPTVLWQLAEHTRRWADDPREQGDGERGVPTP